MNFIEKLPKKLTTTLLFAGKVFIAIFLIINVLDIFKLFSTPIILLFNEEFETYPGVYCSNSIYTLKRIPEPFNKDIVFLYYLDKRYLFIDRQNQFYISPDEDYQHSVKIKTDFAQVYNFKLSPNKKYLSFLFTKKRASYDPVNVAILDLDNQKIKTFEKDDSTYSTNNPEWSNESIYLSFTYSDDNVNGAQIIEIDTDRVVLSIEYQKIPDLSDNWGFLAKHLVSPIVWKPNGTEISYIADGKLVISNIDGSGKKIISDDVAVHYLGDKSSQSFKPEWSSSGKFIKFYKHSNLEKKEDFDLYIYSLEYKTSFPLQPYASLVLLPYTSFRLHPSLELFPRYNSFLRTQYYADLCNQSEDE